MLKESISEGYLAYLNEQVGKDGSSLGQLRKGSAGNGGGNGKAKNKALLDALAGDYAAQKKRMDEQSASGDVNTGLGLDSGAGDGTQ